MVQKREKISNFHYGAIFRQFDELFCSFDTSWLISFQYLKVVKELPGYNCITLPYCLSSVRHDGYVIPRLTFISLDFIACNEMGEPEVSFP